MRISSNNSFCFQNKNVSHTKTNDALHEEANAGKIKILKSYDFQYVTMLMMTITYFFSGYREQLW